MEEKKEKIKRICELANELTQREWEILKREIDRQIIRKQMKELVDISPDKIYEAIKFELVNYE